MNLRNKFIKLKKTFFLLLILNTLISLVFAYNFKSRSNSPIIKPKFSENITQNHAVTRGGISANPSTVNINAGSGQLGRWLGAGIDSGIELGGSWDANGNYLFRGGNNQNRLTGNNLLILGLTLDTKKLNLWPGGLFGVQYLQFNGMNTNQRAGVVQGFDNLPGAPPLSRSELYQLWYRQSLFDDKLIVRMGKTVPTYNFNNVLRPVPESNPAQFIPTVSGLTYTPIFVNPTLYGVMPGYYNSAYGITTTFAPTNNYYLSGGAYDGSLANGVQTGLTGPHFDGYYFYIGETGLAWQAGNENKPGLLAIGGWDQTGKSTASNGIQQNGTQGLYSFGSQRLWYRHPGIDDSGVSGFFQLGINEAQTLPIKKYAGAGLTAFALTRPKDSFGIGFAWSKLNPNLFDHNSELMCQTYYQAHLFWDTYLDSALSYIPNPGASKNLPETWAGTFQVITLF